MGLGGQDVDIKMRCQRQFPGQTAFVRMTRATLADSHRAIGYLVPNAENPREDRGSAKVVFVANPQGLSWGQMNDRNWRLFSQRLDAGLLIRSRHVAEVDQLGWRYDFVAAAPAAPPLLLIRFEVGASIMPYAFTRP